MEYYVAQLIFSVTKLSTYFLFHNNVKIACLHSNVRSMYVAFIQKTSKNKLEVYACYVYRIFQAHANDTSIHEYKMAQLIVISNRNIRYLAISAVVTVSRVRKPCEISKCVFVYNQDDYNTAKEMCRHQYACLV